MQLLFKEYTWYLRAFCRKRQAMRLFKVLRMKRVEVLEEAFPPRCDSNCESDCDYGCKPGCEPGQAFHSELPEIVFQIAHKEAYRVYDRFDEEEITILPDGDFRICMRCFPDDWIYGLILSFGPSAKVLAPAFVREEMIRRIRDMQRNYISL